MSQYLLTSRGAEDVETERLALLERYHDPFTIRQLDAIGVGKGWRCLDVGAGGGSTTRLLSDRIGDSGSVLATDLDPQLLESLADHRIRVLRHDLLVDALPDGAFDLAHARLVLLFLPARLEALRRMIASVRPGGWIAVLDVDFSSVRVSPSTTEWNRGWSAFLDAFLDGGGDPRFGARLAQNFDALDLEDVETQYERTDGRGGSLIARLLGLTIERLRPRMLALGVTDDDVDEAQRLLEDPTTRLSSPTTVLARARRPGG